MSLGLKDLQRTKKTAETSSGSGSPSGSGAVSENWARTSRTARPWTSAGLNKGPKARKNSAGAYMNEEWANDHTNSLQAFDMEVPSPLAQLKDLHVELKEQALELERKIKRAVMSPFEIAKSVLRLVQK